MELQMSELARDDASFNSPATGTSKNKNLSEEEEEGLSTIMVYDANLATYLKQHYDEIMALVDERRRPKYADQWEEI
jgi:hypothetical protein